MILALGRGLRLTYDKIWGTRTRGSSKKLFRVFFGFALLTEFITITSHDQWLVITEPPDDGAVIIIVYESTVVDGGSTGSGAVVTGSKLSEPASHPPVAECIVSQTRGQDQHDQQHPYPRAHCALLRDGDAAWVGGEGHGHDALPGLVQS